MRLGVATAALAALATIGSASARASAIPVPDSAILKPPLDTTLNDFKRIASWAGADGLKVWCTDDDLPADVSPAFAAADEDNRKMGIILCRLFADAGGKWREAPLTIAAVPMTVEFEFMDKTSKKRPDPLLYEVELTGAAKDYGKLFNAVYRGHLDLHDMDFLEAPEDAEHGWNAIWNSHAGYSIGLSEDGDETDLTYSDAALDQLWIDRMQAVIDDDDSDD